MVDHVQEYASNRKPPPITDLHPNGNTYARFMALFLQDGNKEINHTSFTDNILISDLLMSHFILFYATFIAPESVHEVNISDKTRRSIAKILSKSNGKVMVNVFDVAALEVMESLFLNTFKRFVMERKQMIKDREIPVLPSRV